MYDTLLSENAGANGANGETISRFYFDRAIHEVLVSLVGSLNLNSCNGDVFYPFPQVNDGVQLFIWAFFLTPTVNVSRHSYKFSKSLSFFFSLCKPPERIIDHISSRMR